jgi:hypothetical protein
MAAQKQNLDVNCDAAFQKRKRQLQRPLAATTEFDRTNPPPIGCRLSSGKSRSNDAV